MKLWTTKNGYQLIQVLGGRSNVFLVCHEGRHLLIDSGRARRWEDMAGKLGQLSVNRDSLKALILTHTHFDHVENAWRVKDMFNANIIVHQNEEENIRRGRNPVINGSNILTGFVVQKLGGMMVKHLDYTPVEPDIIMDEPFDLARFGFDGLITHTPGHTAGSVSIIIDNDIALVGDTMYGVFPDSAYPPFAENPEVMVRSWEKLLATSCRLYLPSHGSAIHRQVLQKEYDKHMNRLKKL